ncbi:Dual specificity tyrosine-phosphorylation-regulated kinase 4 [Tritrichomonas foetus]|uniref:dual-specificity kinase n=1 Tax=Tritrichomonas foetus TaxID=1144522 RepID=A0A1J4JWG7_9EUKA|nr:Dual specificity tyrosine-phosphorylation-regulated kinase 4 [Tritrichomonas foetus]|eukprot:OHT03487.1 Dual specificity tyrosine-phosphorylation-regulated kinase 4 [Tritrichomonas foetus]
MKKPRISLPIIERFSRNPRFIRESNPVPVLSLLGINSNNPPNNPSYGGNNSTARSNKSYNNYHSARPRPSMSLPPLSKIPGLSNFDESLVKPLPGAPLTASEVLQVFSDRLAPLEIGEILKYREIYYIGDVDNKPFRASYESDYDDRKKQYRALPNDHINYRYQVLCYAGGGAFSTVYRCFDHKLKIPVAVKIIRAKPDCLQYAELEAKIQSKLRGNHSVRLIESFNFRGHYCLSMELLFTDIYSIVEKKDYQQLPPDSVRHITFQTLLCLREMSALGIVHADIKPENILTNDDSLINTKVADFGTACFAEEQMFTYIQSRYYRAPEVLYGIRYGPPIDMWSLGCVVYELIIGQPLFPAQDEEELATMLTISLGPPPRSIYGKASKWRLFPQNRRPEDLIIQDCDIQPIAFMVAILPRPIAKFIRACLVWDPTKRITPDEALQTDWMQEEIKELKKKQAKMAQRPKIKEPSTARRPHWHNK